MTETELRKEIAGIMTGWIGGAQGSAIHREILDIWNGYVKNHGLPQAYESYPWCAETVSAAWIKAGVAAYVPISLSCGQMIEQAKKLGVWQEMDSYIPRISDAVIYDWDDGGYGDDKSGHDHVGLVVSVDKAKKTFDVVEGNAGSPSKVRRMLRRVDQRYIRGYICPKYAAIAKKMTPAKPVEEQKPVSQKPSDSGAIKIAKGAVSYTVQKGDTLSEIAKAAGTTVAKLKEINGIKNANLIRSGQVIRLKEDGQKDPNYKKTLTVTAPIGLNIRKEPVDGTILTAMPYKAKCTCDGTYKSIKGTKWLKIQYEGVTGWSCSKYLA